MKRPLNPTKNWSDAIALGALASAKRDLRDGHNDRALMLINTTVIALADYGESGHPVKGLLAKLRKQAVRTRVERPAAPPVSIQTWKGAVADLQAQLTSLAHSVHRGPRPSGGETGAMLESAKLYRVHPHPQTIARRRAAARKAADGLAKVESLRPIGEAPDAPGQCTATTKAGTQCRRIAVVGGDKCRQHAK